MLPAARRRRARQEAQRRPRRPRSRASRRCASRRRAAHDPRPQLQGQARPRTRSIFRGPDGRTAFAKPRRASRTKLVVTVPRAVARLVRQARRRPKPDPLQAARAGGQVQQVHLAPALAGDRLGRLGPRPGAAAAAVAAAAAPAAPATDYDGDLLSNALEAQLKPDPCIADTDGDGVEDGYEYQSAIDLNHYPRTRRCPTRASGPTRTRSTRPTARRRHRLRRRRPDAARGVPALARATRPTASGAARARRARSSACSTATACRRPIDSPPPPRPPACSTTGRSTSTTTACSRDDERDADGDGLGNWDEERGRMTEGWWPAQHDGENEPKESEYPDIDFLDNEDLPSALTTPRRPRHGRRRRARRRRRQRPRRSQQPVRGPAARPTGSPTRSWASPIRRPTPGPTRTRSTPASPSTPSAATRTRRSATTTSDEVPPIGDPPAATRSPPCDA